MSKVKEEKRLSEDKKYAQVAPDTIAGLAESVGISNLSQHISQAVSEDVSFRARELTHICSRFMRHGKRRKLSSDDVSRAMKWFDTPPVFGVGGSHQLTLHSVPETEVYVNSNNEVDLPTVALTSTPVTGQAEPSLSASWLAIEGCQVSEGEPGKAAESLQSNSLSSALIQYYSAVTSTLLGDSEGSLQVVLEDVRTNPKISGLLPYFVTFVRSGMQRHYESRILIQRLLLFIDVLFKNNNLNFSPKPYLSHLVTALLSSLIPDRPCNPMKSNDTPAQGGHRKRMDLPIDHVPFAALILKDVLLLWATPVNQLQTQTHRALKKFLQERNLRDDLESSNLTLAVFLSFCLSLQ